MTSRQCRQTTSSPAGVWTSSVLWHRSGRSTFLKTLRANPHRNKTDAPPTLPNPHFTRPRFLAKTPPSPALVLPTPWTRAQATRRSANPPSRPQLPLLTLTIRTTTPHPATTTTNSPPWTRCPCSNKHSGSHSPFKACRTRSWQTCSLQQPCRRPTRSATWMARQSSSGNSNITACTRRRCSNISRTSSSRAASNSSSSIIISNSNRRP